MSVRDSGLWVSGFRFWGLLRFSIFSFWYAKHESVDHNKTYVTAGDVHTNTLEGFFSVFKRGMYRDLIK